MNEQMDETMDYSMKEWMVNDSQWCQTNNVAMGI